MICALVLARRSVASLSPHGQPPPLPRISVPVLDSDHAKRLESVLTLMKLSDRKLLKIFVPCCCRQHQSDSAFQFQFHLPIVGRNVPGRTVRGRNVRAEKSHNRHADREKRRDSKNTNITVLNNSEERNS